jgi:sec-independent protein translocase protein TatA
LRAEGDFAIVPADRAHANEEYRTMVPGWLQILVVVILALLLFGGRGKISALMGDFAQGIKSFKKGMSDDVADSSGAEQEIKTIDHKSDEKVAEVAKERKAG